MFVYDQTEQLRYRNYIMRIKVPSLTVDYSPAYGRKEWSDEVQLECDTEVEKALDGVMEEFAQQGWMLHSVTPIKVEGGHDQAFLLVFSSPAIDPY